MWEHVIDYYRGRGKNSERWNIETPDCNVDASSVFRTLIGGRLDWVAFGAAAKRLLPRLSAEPTRRVVPLLWSAMPVASACLKRCAPVTIGLG